VLPPVLLTILVPVPLVILFGPLGLLALLAPLAAAAFGVASYRAAGWSLDSGRLVLRERGLQRSTLVADPHRLPEVFARTTPFQRRGDLSTLGVAVSSGRRIDVRHLDATTAAELLARLTRLATAH
jgi:uncharacterized membrane protein YdbT with pleckstrin-like domain